jgi:ketosteroid isomerase-like protein
MSEESATPDLEELMRQIVDAYNRRDFDGIMAMYSDTPIWDTSAVGLGLHTGPNEVRAFHEDWIAAYEDFGGRVVDLLDLGNGVSVTVFHQRGRPKGSSAFVELRFALLTTWAGGRIEQVVAFTDIDEARAAAERLAEERG